ncbi:MAG TPA: serine hydrolase domain-containing protein, partial [Gemmatimonadota bacterium]
MRPRAGSLLVALLALPLPRALHAQDPGAVVDGETARAADDYLTRLEALGFSGAALLVEDGRTVLRKGYGLADREAGIPITTASVFSLGSITKQFTAAAILALEARGELSTDDPISEYFADVPPDKQPITLHHLLTHSSG